MKHMILKYFQDVFEFGCIAFDSVISRALPIVLMVAVDARIGDILPLNANPIDQGRFTKLQDVELSLPGEDVDVSNVEARIFLRYQKGQK